MRSERLCSLSRELMGYPASAMNTLATQWLERTLDDSAARRIYLPEAMLACDGCLILLLNITDGLAVYPAVIQRNLDAELPFMATENIIVALTEKGVSRQDAHEEIRVLSHQAAAVVKNEGKPNDLIERIRQTPFYAPIIADLDRLLDPKTFIGRAPQQVERFVGGAVEAALKRYKDAGVLDGASGAALNV